MTEAEIALAKRVGNGIRGRRSLMEPQLTQEQLAERAGLHPVYISEVETGKRNMSIAVCARIVNALGVRLSDFFGEIGE